MAKMSLEYKFDALFLKPIIDSFPGITRSLLANIGKMGQKQLEFNLLNGQYIKLIKKPTDKKGRRTINFSVLKGMKGVKISSYPLNLHDPKRAYKKLAPYVESNIDKVVKRWDRDFFNKILNEAK